jgi:hypothetical protein
MEKSSIILHMENKTLTSLKAWKQTQEKIKLIAALSKKSMLQILDEMATEKLKQLQRKQDGEKKL